MRLLVAHLFDIERRHVLDARVRERHPRDAAGRDTEHRNVGWHAARQAQVQQRLAVAIVDEEEVAGTPLPELDEHARTLPPLRFDVTRERAHRRRLHDGTERKFHAEAPRDFRKQGRREQRGASEREVVIGYPKPFDLEQLLP